MHCENISQLTALVDYATSHTQPEPNLLLNLIQETATETTAPTMLSGRIVGRLLKLLVQISNAANVLEIGTFTGYSALCMAEALPSHGRVLTCDIDRNSTAIAEKYFNRSPHGYKISLAIGDALQTIKTTSTFWDLVFIDADKQNYDRYYEAVLPKLRNGGLIVIDNALFHGEVLAPNSERAKVIAALNDKISCDARVENVLLPVRDGVNVVRKK